MELSIHLNDKKLKIDDVVFKKMSFIYNALQDGWSVKKKKESYIFSKTHEGKKEIFLDSYLSKFIQDNVDLNNILNS